MFVAPAAAVSQAGFGVGDAVGEGRKCVTASSPWEDFS